MSCEEIKKKKEKLKVTSPSLYPDPHLKYINWEQSY